MAMNRQNLVSALEAAFSDKLVTPKRAAENIANAIDAYIRSATVNTVVTGVVVGGTTVEGTGKGSLS